MFTMASRRAFATGRSDGLLPPVEIRSAMCWRDASYTQSFTMTAAVALVVAMAASGSVLESYR